MNNLTELEKHAIEIKKLVCSKKFVEALKLIDLLGKDETMGNSDIVRSKSMAESAIGENKKALESIEAILDLSQEEADWHIAGEISLELGELEKSRSYLTKAIDLSLEKEQSYYLSTCYLERAYVNFNLGSKTECIDDLNNVSEDVSIFWLKGIEPINKKSIMSKLNNQ